MIDGRRILAVIPARGGSKGIPRKNLVPLGGKPLMAWTIEAALKSTSVDAVLVSSDDDEILEVAASLGADALKRPKELAEDDSPGIEPVLHAIEIAGDSFEIVACLQPTSPLRGKHHIDEATSLLAATGADSCASVSIVSKPPNWMFYVDDNELLSRAFPELPFHNRRQDTSLYALNGAIYLARVSDVRKEKKMSPGLRVAYRMSNESSVDIDSELDLQFAEFLIERGRRLGAIDSTL
jgi:CMP-N,N'-diacetyllegionaminic acid synthase